MWQIVLMAPPVPYSAEKDLQFAPRALHAVRSMYQVVGHDKTEVASNGPRHGLFRVGGAHDCAGH